MQRRRLMQLLGLAGAAPTLAIGQPAARWQDDDWLDAARQRRLPVRIRWPAGNASCGLVVFSHGLGGDRSGGAVWAQAWQAAGLAVVAVQHPGSDTAVWRAGLAALRQGGSLEQYLARLADAHFVLNEIERRQRDEPAWQRVALNAIGFCGHSFGARLTQAIAGELPPGLQRAAGSGLPAVADAMRDARPRAFIAFSPGFGATEGNADFSLAARARFGSIERPFLCVTGTLDNAMIVGAASAASRRAVYRGLPAGQKAELVLAGADHMTFGGRDLPVERGAVLRREAGAAQREPGHRAVVAQVTSDWWRWRLLGDDAARGRLIAPAGLSAADSWQQG